jgi:hypothetical protein
MYNKYLVGLIALIVVGMVISPALAIPNPSIYPMPYEGNDNQYTNGYINGNGNDQVVYSDHTDNNYNGKVNQKAISDVNGNNNDVDTVNNAYTVNGDVTSGATAVNNQQSVTVNLPKSAAYYGLDTGVFLNKKIISPYIGQVVVKDLDNVPQVEGDVYRCSVWTSLPTFTYAVNNNQVNRVKHDDDVAPTHDDITDDFDLSNLDIITDNEYRSPQQEFEVVIPENGWYSLVIDTRVSQSRNGKQTHISDDSVDVYYTIIKIKNGNPLESKRTIIGNTETFKVLEDGTLDTTQSVIGKI